MREPSRCRIRHRASGIINVMTKSKLTSDLDAVRAQLHNARGPQLWRSLDQMADTPAFRDLVEREFPQGASELNDPVSRRSFLKLMGASLALAGISGCTYMPREKITPFINQPLGRVPGVPLYYASSVLLNGFATGVLVRSNDGRPTKIEPNPQHPGSAGGTDLFVQAEILTMYDPDRSTEVQNQGATSTWDAFTGALAGALQAQSATGGAGLRLLTTTVTSPTLASQISQLQTQYPQARWYQYDPINRDNVYEGARRAFGGCDHALRSLQGPGGAEPRRRLPLSWPWLRRLRPRLCGRSAGAQGHR